MENLPEDILFMIAEFGASYKVSDKRWFDEIRLIDHGYSLEALLTSVVQYDKLAEEIGKMKYKSLFYDLIGYNWDLSVERGAVSFSDEYGTDLEEVKSILESKGYKVTYFVDNYLGESVYTSIDVAMEPIEICRLVTEFSAMYKFIRNNPLAPTVLEKQIYPRTHKYVSRIKNRHIPPSTSTFNSQILDQIKSIHPGFSMEQEYRKIYEISRLIKSLRNRGYFYIIQFIESDGTDFTLTYNSEKETLTIKWISYSNGMLLESIENQIESTDSRRSTTLSNMAMDQVKEVIVYLWDGLPGSIHYSVHEMEGGLVLLSL